MIRKTTWLEDSYYDKIFWFNRVKIDNHHLFLHYHAAVYFPASVGKMDWLGDLPPQICSDSHFIANLCPAFYLKAYLQHTELLRRNSDKSWVSSLCLGNSRQQMPVCAKIIPSLVRDVLNIAKVNTSFGTLRGAVGSAA